MKKMTRGVIGVGMVMVCGLLVACVSLTSRINPDYDASKPHHRPDDFANRYAERSDKPGLLRWQWERHRDGLPKPPTAPVLGVAPDLVRDVKAKRAIGIHWGTFEGLSDEPIDQAPKDLEIAKSTSSVPIDFSVLKHGQTWVKSSH